MKEELMLVEKLFDNRIIRTVWNSEEEKFYISVVDVVTAITESKDGRKYWNKLKQRLNEEGNETVTNCHQLKLKSLDGKNRMTDVVDIEGMFRLIESIPSKKAEPIKLWLATLGKERIDEEFDPELTINRALEAYKRKGYSEDWISSTEISKSSKNSGYENVKDSVIKGGTVAKNAKEQIEKETGKKIVTGANNKDIKN